MAFILPSDFYYIFIDPEFTKACNPSIDVESESDQTFTPPPGRAKVIENPITKLASKIEQTAENCLYKTSFLVQGKTKKTQIDLTFVITPKPDKALRKEFIKPAQRYMDRHLKTAADHAVRLYSPEGLAKTTENVSDELVNYLTTYINQSCDLLQSQKTWGDITLQSKKIEVLSPKEEKKEVKIKVEQ
jgi:hypothetical protein